MLNLKSFKTLLLSAVPKKKVESDERLTRLTKYSSYSVTFIIINFVLYISICRLYALKELVKSDVNEYCAIYIFHFCHFCINWQYH